MNVGKRNPIRTLLITALVILFSSAFAITVHAIMPAAVDVTEFDGPIVKMFGFPAVAVSYFLILYIQCAMAVRLIIVIGINWVIFYSFIGLILDGAMPQMLLRGGIDVIILLLACCVTEKLSKKSYSKKHGVGGIEI